ncbi:MAG: site-specific integrase [Myxococcota bacterium]|jgi:integrase
MPADSAPVPAVDPATLAAAVALLSNPAFVTALANPALLAALGGGTPTRQVPTVEAYLPVVQKAAKSSTSDTYGTYWRLLVRDLGDKGLDEVRTTDLKALANTARSEAVKRRNSRDGRSAEENCVGALRAFFRCAVDDGLITTNPASAVPKPKRQPSQRRALTAEEYAELDAVTRSGGNDPLLDTLLLRFHTETGARRGGAVALTLADLDTTNSQVALHEKGGTLRWQPVSPTLLAALRQHANARGAQNPSDQVFRYLVHKGDTVGAPLTRRRYNTLANRWQKALPWAAQYGVSPHWLRHTAVTAAERLSGSFGVARAFAGHAVPDDATTTYIKAGTVDVATVVAQMTGETHPLAAAQPQTANDPHAPAPEA